MSERHAYLIIAHNQFEILQELIKALDYPGNDIYVHIDKKAKFFKKDMLDRCANKSKVIILDTRLDVKWGDFTQIACELLLLKAAIEGEYAYYHLMSGVDMPIKTQEYIHSFFYNNKGTEFIHFEAPEIDGVTKKRVEKFHFFPGRNKSLLKKILNRISLEVQFFVDRTKKTDMKYQKGANWFSITHSLASYIVQNEKRINTVFSKTLCGDEMFLQTLVESSYFKECISKPNYCDSYESIMYCIDWERGTPYEYTSDDFDDLMQSKMLFARKFNSTKDFEVVKKIRETVTD